MAGIVKVKWTLPTVADAQRASRYAITRAALQAISGIQRDTARGVDVRGQPFVPYSRAYAAKRAATGRKPTPPDLTLTGTLLRALRLLRVDGPRRAIIGWEGLHTARNVFGLAGYSSGRLRQVMDGRVGAAMSSGPLTKAQDSFLRAAKRQKRKALKDSGRDVLSVPYAALVRGLERHRRFFGIETPERRRLVVKTYRDALVETVSRDVKRAHGKRT